MYLQTKKVEDEWKSEYLYTLTFSNLNSIKGKELPGRINEFKPKPLNFTQPAMINNYFVFFLGTHA